MTSQIPQNASLDEQLSTYSAIAASNGPTGKKPASAARVLGYGAASAALAIGSAAEASIMFSGPQNIVLSGSSSVFLDLDNNGVDDFSVFLHTSTSTSAGVTTFSTGGIDMSGLVAGNIIAIAGTTNTVRRYATSNQIGPGFPAGSSAAFFTHATTSSGVLTSSFATGFGTNTGIMGVQFDIAGSNHVAWIRVDVDVNANGVPDNFEIIEWAWESQADTAIHAGSTSSASVPEPAAGALVGLGLLAAGAAGLRRTRRQRAASKANAQASAHV